MSTISRRDFMKTAGVMTLAVAASAALAGCSTEASSSTAEVTKTSANSATLGDYTVSLSSKLYKVTTYKTDPDDVSADEATKVDNVKEYLFVLVSVKHPDQHITTMDWCDEHTDIYGLTRLPATKLAKGVFGKAMTSSQLYAKDVNYVYDDDGSYYCYGFEVNQKFDGSFATPKFEINFLNHDKKSYTTITAPIPAAEDVKPSDYAKLVG